MEFPDIVELNVGGRHLSTFLSTLTKYPDSMLAAMFSGRQPVTRDKDDRFFIDADADVFTHLLNFLRFETMPPSDKAAQVKQYAEYLGLDELKTRLNSVTVSTYDELFANWESKIICYEESLSSVKYKLMNWDLGSGYIFLYVTLFDICNKEKPTSTYPRPCRGEPGPYDLPEHLKGIPCSLFKVPTKCDVRSQARTLMTLLSIDLKQYRLSPETITVRSCCYVYRLFKVV